MRPREWMKCCLPTEWTSSIGTREQLLSLRMGLGTFAVEQGTVQYILDYTKLL